VWRYGIYDKMAGAPHNEMLWDTIFGLIRVYQGPDKGLVVRWLEIQRSFVNTLFHKQITGLLCVPDDWLALSKASA
jgi:hypothetical protein